MVFTIILDINLTKKARVAVFSSRPGWLKRVKPNKRGNAGSLKRLFSPNKQEDFFAYIAAFSCF